MFDADAAGGGVSSLAESRLNHVDAVFDYLSAASLLASAAIGWLLTLFGMPGNWFIVGAAALYAWLGPAGGALALEWNTVIVLAAMAGVAEALEFAAGMVGARRAGGSGRAAWYSLFGSLVGAIAGAAVGLPLPIVGSLAGTILGAAAGAMGGAVLAEYTIGSSREHSLKVGQAAFWGRLTGTLAKVIIASIMVVTTLASVIW